MTQRLIRIRCLHTAQLRLDIIAAKELVELFARFPFNNKSITNGSFHTLLTFVSLSLPSRPLGLWRYLLREILPLVRLS